MTYNISVSENELHELENLHNSRGWIHTMEQPKLKVQFWGFFPPSFYSFNILTKDDFPKFKKIFEKYTVSYYLHNIWVQVAISYK